MNDDTALVKAAQAGDASAFERLLNQHYDTIFRFALKWCGSRHEAEDVAQQVCIKLSRSIAKFRFESAFSTWLYRVVVNTAKDHQAKQRSHEPIGPEAENKAVQSSDESLVFLFQLLKKVERWGEGMKETLLLVHGEGLSHGEAAKVLGVKESTVSWRLHEIRKKLSDSHLKDEWRG